MNKDKKIVFMGTPQFAVEALKKLHESNHQIVGVVCPPDRPGIRGKKLKSCQVKQYAVSQNLKVLQPEKLKSPQFISKLTNLKIISCFGVGYDSIDVNAALERNIIVTHTPNVLNEEVASTTLLLLLAAKRQLISNYNWIIDGNWEKKGNAPLTNTIEKLHVGLLGYGRIGQAIARKLLAFNCNISYHARNKVENSSYKYYKNLLEMARNVECLIVITPGGPDTEKIVDKSVIEALGPKGTLINIARGSVVDEKALVDCVINKKIGSVALDVFENEPKVPRELFNLDNVLLAPHIGSSTHETRKAMLDLVIENLELYYNNKRVRTPVPECNKLINEIYK